MNLLDKLRSRETGSYVSILLELFSKENLNNQILPKKRKVVMVYEERKAFIVDLNYRMDFTVDIYLLIDGFEYEMKQIKESVAQKYLFNKTNGISVYQLANGRIIYKEPKEVGYIASDRAKNFRGTEILVREIDDLQRFDLFLDFLFFQYKLMSFLTITLTSMVGVLVLAGALFENVYSISIIICISLSLITLSLMLNRLDAYTTWNNFLNKIGHFHKSIELKRRT